MSEILFLSHRIPYPPEKGDKIRSYHLLRTLAADHTVHLGTFVDDAADWRHIESLRKICGGETCFRALQPRVARMRSLRGLFGSQSLTLGYYRDSKLDAWVRSLGSRRPLAGIFAFSSSMGQYALNTPLACGAPRVMDFCDVDSDKWQQYASAHRFPMSAVYAREAKTLAALEARYVREFEASLVISPAEAELLHAVAMAGADRIRVIPNGVDTRYFDPARPYESPFESSDVPIVFTGAMDYRANVDGVQWFVREIFPRILEREPRARFAIVGSNPVEEVRSLVRERGIIVTGRVPDVRPYLAHAAVAVAPLRLARGMQNKVLEALAMERRVVATRNAAQGIPAATEPVLRVADEPTEFSEAVLQALVGEPVAPHGRAFVMARYGWDRHLQYVKDLFPVSRGSATVGRTGGDPTAAVA
jgi:sugar transferase (PEP-CTERM/EpsH1 system associated)